MSRKQLFTEAFIASALTILLVLILSFFTFRSEFIKPVHQGLYGFDIYDLRFNADDPLFNKMDTGMTIVEIGNSRDEIAHQLSFIETFQPRLIGVDAIFEKPRQSAYEDSALLNVLRRHDNIIVASKYDRESLSGKEHFTESFFKDSLPELPSGFFNLVEGPEEIKRHFLPFLSVENHQYPAFTTRMLMKLSPPAFNTLVRRRHRIESINYSGGMHRFNIVSREDLFGEAASQNQQDLFHNKIVLLGFLRDKKPDVLEDLHFTPLNHKLAGKSFPDMYGVIIHANILEMMLKGNYIHEVPQWLVYLITFLLVFFINVYYIRRLSKKKKEEHLFLFFFQFLVASLLVYLALLAFRYFNIKLDLTPVMIATVLSLEIFWLYELIAAFLKRKFGYKTFVHA